MKKWINVFIVLSALVVSSAILFAVHIPDGNEGIRLTTFGNHPGLQPYVIQPGLTWRIPFLSKVEIYPVRDAVFHLKNRRGSRGSPHRAILFVNLKGHLKQIAATVHYRMIPSRLIDYAEVYFGVNPRVVIEGILRITATENDYDNLNELQIAVQENLDPLGIQLLSLKRYEDERTRERFRKAKKRRHRKKQEKERGKKAKKERKKKKKAANAKNRRNAGAAQVGEKKKHTGSAKQKKDRHNLATGKQSSSGPISINPVNLNKETKKEKKK